MPGIAASRAVFLDRDGTLIEEKKYLANVEDVTVFPGVPAALRRLREAGFRLFVVTNQSGVGRGYFTMADVEKVHAYLTREFALDGVRLDAIYVAPEHPEKPSRGRKPSPQFLFDARDEFDVDLSQSYLIGDKVIDLECGWNAGVKKSILVRTGYGAALEKKMPELVAHTPVFDDFPAAAQWIIRDSKP